MKQICLVFFGFGDHLTAACSEERGRSLHMRPHFWGHGLLTWKLLANWGLVDFWGAAGQGSGKIRRRTSDGAWLLDPNIEEVKERGRGSRRRSLSKVYIFVPILSHLFPCFFGWELFGRLACELGQTLGFFSFSLFELFQPLNFSSTPPRGSCEEHRISTPIPREIPQCQRPCIVRASDLLQKIPSVVTFKICACGSPLPSASLLLSLSFESAVVDACLIHQASSKRSAPYDNRSLD